MRLSVTLDPELVEEAVRLSHARSKRQAIEAALKEFIRRRRLEGMIARAGKVPLALSVEDLLKRRAEE
ncbi:MAG TPA: type II toxin-antitoxin system VapB family antitoxin [Candidatus Sulfotelmatobacter sp.]|nr:type II toxin-antitoxin system VapB family antitoxin [Candidatus Sulfotelmatobacter sp.]